MQTLWLLGISVPTIDYAPLAYRLTRSAAPVSNMGDRAQTRDAGSTTILTHEDRRPPTVPHAAFCFGPGMWCDGDRLSAAGNAGQP
jgi:hypothetical protein